MAGLYHFGAATEQLYGAASSGALPLGAAALQLGSKAAGKASAMSWKHVRSALDASLHPSSTDGVAINSMGDSWGRWLCEGGRMGGWAGEAGPEGGALALR